VVWHHIRVWGNTHSLSYSYFFSSPWAGRALVYKIGHSGHWIWIVGWYLFPPGTLVSVKSLYASKSISARRGITFFPLILGNISYPYSKPSYHSLHTTLSDTCGALDRRYKPYRIQVGQWRPASIWELRLSGRATWVRISWTPSQLQCLTLLAQKIRTYQQGWNQDFFLIPYSALSLSDFYSEQ